MKLVFGGKQARAKLASDLFAALLLVACLLYLVHAKQEPVIQEVNLDFMQSGEQPKVAEPGIALDKLAGEELKPQDMEKAKKLESYLITMLDDVTQEEFDDLINYLNNTKNRAVSERTFQTYIKFFVSSLHDDDVEELNKRKKELKIESIDLDDLVYTEKSEL